MFGPRVVLAGQRVPNRPVVHLDVHVVLRLPVVPVRLKRRPLEPRVQPLPLDPPVLTRHTEAIAARLRALTSAAESLLNGPINLASAQQVSEALHVTLRLPKPTQGNAAARATQRRVLPTCRAWSARRKCVGRTSCSSTTAISFGPSGQSVVYVAKDIMAP